MDLSVIIAARNEEFLQRTIEDVLKASEADTEVIAVLDGYWPEPGIHDHPKVKLIHHTESIGQRAAVNEGVKLSRAKYMMKLDAHCTVDQGFDRKLMADCEHNWTVVPRMYNLHAFDWECKSCKDRTYQGPKPEKCEKCGHTEFGRIIVWQPRWNRKSDFMRFDNDLKFQYWRAYGKRPEAKGDIVPIMSFIGACWFMEIDRYWEIDGLDEKHGSWGQVGTEIACKSWLSGGKLMVNKKTWFSHLFRTQKGFGFPYHLSGKQVMNAKKHSKKLWLQNKWPKAKHDVKWLVEKFAPVPDWDVLAPVKAQAPKKKRGMVYYSDNTGDPFFMEACRKQMQRCADMHDLSITSVTQKPLDFGRNIVVDLERAVLSIFKQILLGCEESNAEIIFLLEHDMIYHPDHFKLNPAGKDIFTYDHNRWSVCDVTGKCVFYHTDVPSMMVAHRDHLIQHYKRVVDFVTENGWRGKYGYSPPKGLPKEMRKGGRKVLMADFPSLDVRRGESFTRKRMTKDQFRSERSCRGWTEAGSVPGWGQIEGRFDDFIKDLWGGK